MMLDDMLKRFKALAVKKSIFVSSLNDQELGIVAFSASRCIDVDPPVSEKVFTPALADWLDKSGGM